MDCVAGVRNEQIARGREIAKQAFGGESIGDASRAEIEFHHFVPSAGQIIVPTGEKAPPDDLRLSREFDALFAPDGFAGSKISREKAALARQYDFIRRHPGDE